MREYLREEEFKLLSQYFPIPRKPETVPLKRCLNAILYVLHEGCSWRGLPDEYRKKPGDWHTIYTRYKRWSESGLLGKIFRMLEKADVLQVRIAFMDSTIIRAHHCASGAVKKRGLNHLGDQKEDSRARSIWSQEVRTTV